MTRTTLNNWPWKYPCASAVGAVGVPFLRHSAAKLDIGERAGQTTDERSELAPLRKENRILREERDVLKWATRLAGVRSDRKDGIS